MKVKPLLDRDRPKVSPAELRKAIEEAGFHVGSRGADLGVVVGGDGLFSAYGRTEDMPLLFVGVRSNKPTGTKAFLSEVYFDELPQALKEFESGQYKVVEYKRLEVIKNGRTIGQVFTDVYLQRGADSNALRYRVKVSGHGVDLEDMSIGDGVVVTTPAGATGYYSYPDKIGGEELVADAHATLSPNEVGICHIVPIYTQRSGSDTHPLRYVVPWGSKIELSITRHADARLYGVGPGRDGLKVTTKDRLAVIPSRGTTKVIRLKRNGENGRNF